MSDGFTGYYPYVAAAGLMLLGLYGMTLKTNLVKKLIGMNILQTAVILLYIVIAAKSGATVPILEHGGADGLGAAAHAAADPEHFVNPLPHALMLTAIVVSVATTGVSLTLLIRIKREFGSLEETDILRRGE